MSDFGAESDRYERLAAGFDEERAPRRHPRRKKKKEEPGTTAIGLEEQRQKQEQARKQKLAMARVEISKHLGHFLKIKGDGEKSKEQKIAEQAQAYSQWVEGSLNENGIIFDREQDITIKPHPKKKKRGKKLVIKHIISLVQATIDVQPLETQEARAIDAIYQRLEGHISTWRSFIDNSEDPSSVNVGETVTGMLSELTR